MTPNRQEIPRAQFGGKTSGSFHLEDVDEDQDDHNDQDRGAESDQVLPARDGQPEDKSRKPKEHYQQVDNGKPTVAGCLFSQGLRQS